MTQRQNWIPLRRIAVAGALGVSFALAGSLAIAQETRGLGRGQPNFGSSLDRSGASGFTPDRRLGDVQRSSPGANLGERSIVTGGQIDLESLFPCCSAAFHTAAIPGVMFISGEWLSANNRHPGPVRTGVWTRRTLLA